MAVYKIPQDVEADDKFIGPLSFKQFIYIGIAVVASYLLFLSLTKGFWPAFIFLSPFIIAGGFLGFPWGRDQPTEIWLAARIRFFIKPRVRIWNQSGVKELVTITVPKKIEKSYTNGLSQNEVNSRLSGLATLLDSRGWAIKNISGSAYTNSRQPQSDDRLLDFDAVPIQVVDNVADADILDETVSNTALHFDQMIKSSEDKHRQDILGKLQTAREVPQVQAPVPTQQADFKFLHNQHDNAQSSGQQALADPLPVFTTFQAPAVVNPYVNVPSPQPVQATAPSLDEEALLQKIHKQQSESTLSYGHLKNIDPIGDMSSHATHHTKPDPSVTAPVDPAIINLANNDDLNVATLARQANKKHKSLDDGEVVISLH